MASYSTSSIKNGLKVLINDDPFEIIDNSFHKPGKGQAFSKVKLKNLTNGRVIERTLKIVTVTITTARPGIIIGKGGQEVDKLKEELKKISGKEVQLNVYEIKRPEVDAYLVASSVARQIENRISYKRAIKMSIAAAMRMNAEGIKIQISGRLNGAEMARNEHYKDGRIPLSTFRADIDYALVEAHTTYGRLGIKVWIMKGEVYGKRELSPLVGLSKKQGKSGGRNAGNKSRRRK